MKTNARKDILLLFAVILWALLILGGYYYYHKPINFEMLAAPLSALRDGLFVLWLVVLAGDLGRRIFPAWKMEPFERLAVEFAIGAGILSLAWFLIGLLGLYRFLAGLILLGLGTLFVHRDIKAWFGHLSGWSETWRRARGLDRLLAILAALVLFYQLLIALAPPIKWDALAYHLQLPRQYLAAEAFIFTPANPYWGHPQLVEMLYTLAMSLHRSETAAVLGWSVGVIFLVGLFGFTNAQFARLRPGERSDSPGWLAVTAVLAGYTFRYLLGWSYTDQFSALFGLSAVIVLFAWLETRRPACFVWSAVFCGLAAGTKWTAGLLGLGLLIVGLIYYRSLGFHFKDLLLKLWLPAGAAALLVVLPWLLKNQLVTGSPLYPYFIGTPWFDSARLASANPPREVIDWALHLLLPLFSTWAGVDSAAGYSADLGPLLLLFAVPGFWVYRHDRGIQVLTILLGLTVLTMAAAGLRFGHLLQTRLYYVMLPCVAVLAGLGFEWLQRQVLAGVRLRRILGALILLVMGLVFWQDSYFIGQITPGRVSLGTITQQSYLENTVGFHILAMQKLADLPASARTLMLWEPRGLYAPLNAQADLWIDRWRTDVRELQTPAAILERWKAEGFTHLLVYQPGVELIRPQADQEPSPEWVVLQELLDQLPAPEAIGDTYFLYPLKSR